MEQVLLKNADGSIKQILTTPDSSSMTYFYVTLTNDSKDLDTGKTVTKGMTWSLPEPMTGWELYSNGYMSGT